jgi:hypothetical protein
VIYGRKHTRKFDRLSADVEEQSKTTCPISYDFSKLYSFHKSLIFKPESEVRLLFDRRNERTGFSNRTIMSKQELVFPIIRQDLIKISQKQSNIQFLDLPILGGNVVDDPQIPLLKLKAIVLGFKYTEEIAEMRRYIDLYCRENFKYAPEVRQTPLAQFYWGTLNKDEA